MNFGGNWRLVSPLCFCLLPQVKRPRGEKEKKEKGIELEMKVMNELWGC